jgi:ATP-binding cassette subfamily C (CFTR/MRP) protein 1
LNPFSFRSPDFCIDLWELPTDDQTFNISNQLEANFYKRCALEKRPRLNRTDVESDTPSRSGTPEKATEEIIPEKSSGDAVTDSKPKRKGKKKVPVYDESLPKALHETFFYRFWLAGFLKLTSGKIFSSEQCPSNLILC